MLKVIMKQRQIELLREKLKGLEAKAEELKTREAELESAIGEVSNDEEIEAVNARLDEHVEEAKANAAEIERLNGEISRMEAELASMEEEQAKPEIPVNDKKDGESIERKEEHFMSIRDSFFGMDRAAKAEFFKREDVKTFIAQIRSAMTRGLSNASVMVPTVVFDIIRQNYREFSKLYSYVTVRRVSGDGRQPVLGPIPEAVWTEACGTVNELNLSFGAVEMDGYKVGGYIPVCNAALEDSDEDLAQIVIEAIGQGIGYALDKAIVAGTGVKMPLGIYTRIAQTAAQTTNHPDAFTWVDYHTSNIVDVSDAATPLELFQQIVQASGNANEAYARGEAVWIMNHKTRQQLAAAGLSFNAAGAIVSGIESTMPVLGGDIVELSFIPDGFVLGGYAENYVLGERRAVTLDRSEHAMFIQDHTVFRGTARFDGQLAIPNSFVVYKTTEGATWSVTFAADTANT